MSDFPPADKCVNDSQAILHAALEYHKLGLSVTVCCPPDHVGVGKQHECDSPGKRPIHAWKKCQELDTRLSESDIRYWLKRQSNANVGAAMGVVVMGIDSDGAGGEPALAEMAQGDLPATWTFTTHNGMRRLYRVPEGVSLKNSNKPIGDGIHEEVRFLCKGTQTVMPPSRHKEGTVYAWVEGLAPGEIELADMPEWLVKLLRDDGKATSRKGKATPGPGRKIKTGERHTEFVRLAGTMRDKGMTADEIDAALQVVNTARCETPEDADTVTAIAADVAARYEPTPPLRLLTIADDGADGADGQMPAGDAPAAENGPSDESGPGDEASKDSQADTLVALAVASKMVFFHTPGATRQAYVSYIYNGHRETWPVKSERFGEYLSFLFYERHEKSVNPTALNTALGHLSAYAKFKGKASPVALRSAMHDGNVYIDLCDDDWQVVRVTKDSWCVLAAADCPVRFYRKPGMLALPVPEPGGSVEELRSVLNLPRGNDNEDGNDDPFILTVAWLIAALWPKGPYPVLAVNGEPGSAKTSFCGYLRGLTDPSEAPFCGKPKSEEDLMIAGHNSWTVCFDNLSGIRTELSNNLCKLATGAGFRTRELYTNDGEKIISIARPCLINGVEDIVQRSDLVDRSLRLMLPAIDEDNRRTAAEVDAEYKRVGPRVLGALLDAVSAAIRNLPTTKLKALPRMADFALLVAAAEEALPWAKGEFLEAYARNRMDMNDGALDDSMIAQYLMRAVDDQGGYWTVTYKELLRVLNLQCTDEAGKKTSDWPKTPKGLSNDLRMLGPVLRREGYEVKHLGHKKTGSLVEFRRVIEKEKDAGKDERDTAVFE
jgi:hypothetical protein